MPSTLGIRTSIRTTSGRVPGHYGDGVASVTSLANNLKIIAVTEQGTQPASYQCLVVGEHCPDHFVGPRLSGL
jgi:hypothetical protein